MRTFTIFNLLIFLLPIYSMGQKLLNVSGVVTDNKQQSVSFATVLLIDLNNNAQNAAYTDLEGKFTIEVPKGKYQLKISLFGFENYTDTLKIESNIKLKNIVLKQGATELDVIEITAEKSLYEMKLDKKVYNVAQDPNNQGADASEILENVPSVTVDGDGNVQLRGSGNVRILINGKPSGLTNMGSAEALQLIQGNMIESIEVITNPSSKYDAEGTTGIINIVLKRQKKEGVQGNLQLNTGLPDNHSALLNLSWQTKKIDWTASGGVGYRSYPAEGGGITKYSGDTTFYFSRDREQMRGGPVYNAQIGADIFVDSTNTVNISTSFFKRVSPNFATLKYEDLNELQQVQKTTIRTEDEHEIKQNIELNVGHTKKFKKPGMKWVTDVNAYNNIDVEDAKLRETFLNNQLDQRAYIVENESSILAQSDFTYPFKKNSKLETGVRNTYRDILNAYAVDELNQSTLQWQSIALFTDEVRYKENVLGSYVQYSSEWKKFSLMTGLRNEWALIEVNQKSLNQPIFKNFNDFFPSVFTSYKLDSTTTLQLSYSKRIDRPGQRELLPFNSYSDPRNQFVGNPNLNPVIIHSMELGLLKYWKKSSFMFTAFYRRENAPTERISFVDEFSIVRTLPVNLQYQNSYGLETNFSLNWAKWWKTSLNNNLFMSEIYGEYKGVEYQNEALVYFLQAQNNFTIKKGWTMNVTNFYRAPRSTAQGNVLAIKSMNISSSHQFMQNKARLTISIRDVFRENVYRRIIDEPNFYSESYFRPRVRMLIVSFNYKFANKNIKKIETRSSMDEE